MKAFVFCLMIIMACNLRSQTNLGFESGNTNGWTIIGGASIQTGPGSDVATGAFPVVCPTGNVYSLMLSNGMVPSNTNGSASQSFVVTPANTCFSYNYAVVLQAAGHTCSSNPSFDISMTANNVPIPCSAVQIVDGCSSVTGWIDQGGISYKPWSVASFDLSAYLGQTVNVLFSSRDCTAGGHWGYAYIDCFAQPIALSLNDIVIPTNQANSFLCRGATNTLCAPDGGFSYNWTGPGVNGLTTQCVNPTTTGTYSVSLSMPGMNCNTPILWSSFSYIDTPVPDFNATKVCYGSITTFSNLTTETSMNTSLGIYNSYSWQLGDGWKIQ